MITNRCNMKCTHCAFACTEKGKDISIKHFKQALEFGDKCVCLGGGEPTLHPHFEKLLLMSISYTTSEGTYIITNGKIKEKALYLAKLAQKRVIGVEVSCDIYHEKIDDEVVKEFEKLGVNQYDNTYIGVRNVLQFSSKPIKSGRCKDGKEKCICPDLFVSPYGDIKICGCLDAPIIGHVSKLKDLDLTNYQVGECWRNQCQDE